MNVLPSGKHCPLLFAVVVAVASVCPPLPAAQQRARGSAWLEALVKRLDKDGDGKLSRDEVRGSNADKFDRWDANHDGFVTVDELRKAAAKVANAAKRRKAKRDDSPLSQAERQRAANPQAVDAENPYEKPGGFAPSNHVDELALKTFAKAGVEPANLCADQTFLRRVYLDLIGILPTPEEWLAFSYQNQSPNKRTELIDALLKRKEFNDYWAMHWCDALRVKAEFPINLWPNGVQAYHRWIHDALRENMPYDQFARELLTSSGSNYRVPQVNFYRAIQGTEPSAIAAAVALTFMGTRLDKWDAAKRAEMEKFFSRVAYKGTQEWKEEIIMLDLAVTEPLDAVLPDGRKVHIPADQDPRQVFADWLIRPDNPWFARAIVNRVWFWLMGRGIIHEPDDIRSDNPPSQPEVLDYLAQEFVRSGYDMRGLIRLICNSSIYQQSARPKGDIGTAERLFACYPVRRLEAEVISDALCWLLADGVGYTSQIPEPWTWWPENERTINLADGSITSEFLEMFGRPPRDTGLASERDNKPSNRQELQLLNSSDIQRRIERSLRFRGCITWAKGDRGKLVDALYVNILSRQPTSAERAAALEYGQSSKMNTSQFMADIAWTLLNSKDFLYRH